MGYEMVTIVVPYGEVQCHAETVKRLERWARWACGRVMIGAKGRCASAEGRYREPGTMAASGVELDLLDVLAVERVVCHLPDRSKMILKQHFVTRSVPNFTARKLMIRLDRYGDELRNAVLMVRNNLRCCHD